jgi:hypothetical protein
VLPFLIVLSEVYEKVTDKCIICLLFTSILFVFEGRASRLKSWPSHRSLEGTWRTSLGSSGECRKSEGDLLNYDGSQTREDAAALIVAVTHQGRSRLIFLSPCLEIFINLVGNLLCFAVHVNGCATRIAVLLCSIVQLEISRSSRDRRSVTAKQKVKNCCCSCE